MSNPRTLLYSRLKRFGTGLFVFCLALLFMEGVSRILAATVFAKKLSKSDLRTKIEKTYIQPVSERKNDSLFVFAYGGSTIAGFPLPKVGVVSQLDYQLHHVFKDKKNIGVYNYGWSGYNSTMIRYMMISTINAKPDVLIVYCCQNEFVSPDIDPIWLQKTIGIWRDRSALVKLLLLTTTNEENGVYQEEPIDRKRWPYRKLPLYYELKMKIFKRNVDAMVSLAREHHTPLIFSTAASNIGEWPPAQKQVTTLSITQDYQLDADNIRSFSKNNKLTEAENIVSIYLKKDPTNASFIYFQAKIEAKRGNWEKAKSLFEQAKELDLLPFRATNDVNNYIRSYHDGKTVWVVDSEKILAEHSPNNLPGYNFFIDNVHPNIPGSYRIATSLFETIKNNALVKKDWWSTDIDPLYTQDEFLDRIALSKEDQLKLALIPARYCLKNPFFNYECVSRYLDQVKAIDPSYWEITALESVMAYLQRDYTKARSLYTQLTSSKNYTLTLEDKINVPYFLLLEKEFNSKDREKS